MSIAAATRSPHFGGGAQSMAACSLDLSGVMVLISAGRAASISAAVCVRDLAVRLGGGGGGGGGGSANIGGGVEYRLQYAVSAAAAALYNLGRST